MIKMTHQEFSSTTSNSTTTTNSISRSYMSTSGEAATTARIVAAPSSNQLSHLEGEEDEEKKDSVFPKASCPEYNEEDEVEKARVAREQAEEEAYQKLVDAVCKASLLEFNEREKAFQQYEASLVNDALQRQESQRKVEEAKYKADLSKRQAVQHILESKIIAKQKSEQAKIALEMYEQKQFEVIEKKMLLENKKQEKKQQEELEKLKQKQQEAMKKRLFAEQKAQEAIEKAKQMRQKAVQAVQTKSRCTIIAAFTPYRITEDHQIFLGIILSSLSYIQ
jgi:hypothetical protein